MKITKKQTASLAALVAILLFLSPWAKFPIIDRKANTYFREAITKAGVAYATCRVINASVSIIKDSQLQVEPAGIGVTLAIGQALDPIDDMTERVSDVMVTAITALGVEKLVYEISVSLALPILAIFLFIFAILIWFETERLVPIQKYTIKLALLVLIVRICLPVSAMANSYLQKHFFEKRISIVNQKLTIGSAKLDKLKNFSLPEIDGVVGTVKNSASFLKRKSIEFKNAFAAAVSKTGDIIENLLNLMFLYVGIFLIQVIILPLLVFWFFVKTANALFQTNIPLKSPDGKIHK